MTSDGTALAGRIAWITGAGSGIGEAAALALAQAGASVVLTGRRSEPLEAVAARIAASGGTAVAMPGDLAQGATAGRIVGEIERRFGRLDILVNNAGLNLAKRAWADLEPDGIDTVLGGNLSAAFYCAAAALRPMRHAKDGRADPHGLLGREIHQPRQRRCLYGRETRRRGDEPEHQRRGVPQRHPFDRASPGRSRDPRSSTSGRCHPRPRRGPRCCRRATSAT